MNTLERKVANLIDKKQSVIWWVRNIAENKKWYVVKGWKKGRIHPDFIAAKKNDNGALQLVYIIESKGEHLIGNMDTEYKKSVFDKMNTEKVNDINVGSLKFLINKDFNFQLVKQGKEETDINRFFNK